jgi:hypothetical protein
MVTEQEALPAANIPRRPPINVMSSAKEEEGPVKGEIWAVLRALAVLMGFIILVGFLIA